MPSFTVNEPHPTVATNSYMHSGRGGAGNFFRAPETTPSAGVPTSASASKKSSSGSRYYFAGRGGAGNAQAASHSPINFEDEYAIASNAERLNTAHVGRGGAGNIYAEAPAKKSHRKSSASSSGSSVRSGFMARLSGNFSR